MNAALFRRLACRPAAFCAVWDGQAKGETPLANHKLHAARFRICVGLPALAGVCCGIGGQPVLEVGVVGADINKKEVNYFQPEQVAAIRDALEEESMKWKVLTHIFLITGARRREILGLKWSAVDFAGNRIHICNNILYSPDVGIYEDTPKTATSDRWITLPDETMQLLRKYQVWQNTERLRLGEYYQNRNYLFAQDNGGPMHPDSVTDWMNKFSKRHELPHINPHAFRHTMASMLYFNGVDSVSISKRLGHAQVSITANIYAHVMEAADRKNADILEDVFLKKA